MSHPKGHERKRHLSLDRKGQEKEAGKEFCQDFNYLDTVGVLFSVLESKSYIKQSEQIEISWSKYIDEFKICVIRLYKQCKDVQCIRRYLKAVKLFVKYSILRGMAFMWEKIDKIVSVIDVLFQLNCDASKLVCEALEVLESNYKWLTLIAFSDMDPKKLKYVLFHARKGLSGTKLEEKWPQCYGESPDLVSLSYYKDEVEKLRIFLNNGYSKHFNVRSVNFSVLSKLGKRKAFYDKLEEEHFENKPTAWRRWILASDVVSLFIESTPGLAQCLKTMWSAIPDAYPTVSEVFEVLDLITIQDNKSAIDSVCQSYKISGIFGDISVSSPRSLKHYCRCTIRKVVLAKCSIYVGIKELPLPSSFRRYIELEDF